MFFPTLGRRKDNQMKIEKVVNGRCSEDEQKMSETAGSNSGSGGSNSSGDATADDFITQVQDANSVPNLKAPLIDKYI